MGSVTRPSLAAALLAVPAIAATVWVTGAPAAALPSQAEARVTTTADFKFVPPEVTISAGGKVTWENTDGSYHTVTGGDGTKDPGSPMQGVIATRGATYTATFPAPGTYKYYCEPHLAMGMTGTVTVLAGGAPATATATAAPAPSSVPPASASASATVGAPQPGAGAPTNAPDDHGAGEEGGHGEAPGIAGNETLEAIEAERAAMEGAVSGFRFFTAAATAFLFILGAAVLFSTRPRRAGR